MATKLQGCFVALASCWCCLVRSSAVFAQVPDTVFLEELTCTEVRDAIKAGRTTIAAGGDAKVTGMSGNPARSSVAYGKMGFALRNTANVAQIEEMIAARSH